MGSAESVPQDLTAKEVAYHLASFGKVYEPYAKQIVENDVDGDFLSKCTEADLPSLFGEFGVDSMVHKKKLSFSFANFKESATQRNADAAAGVPATAPTADMKQAPQLPVMVGGKRYRGFLSHFKHECGTEARLVHTVMSEILTGEDIFLDSGKNT